MKRIILFTCLVFCSLSEAAGVIHVLYGDLKPGQQKILDRVFRPKLNELISMEGVKKVVENPQASIEDLTQVLQSPQTLGVIFLGHPAIKTKGVMPDKKIIHGYLQDTNGRYLPKAIFSAAHEGLKFLSIMTCHESAILPLYLDSLPKHVHYYESPTHNLNSLGNPLFEFTSFYSTPKIIDEIKDDLKNGNFDDFYEPKNKVMAKLEIEVKDLVSQKFGYVVLLNDKFIGSLFAQKNNRGRLLNKTKHQFFLESGEVFAGAKIKIIPDDANRPKPNGLKVVDDILLLKVELEGVALLKQPIHLGDQEQSPDMGEGLGFLRNLPEFEITVFKNEWEVAL